MHIYRRFDPVFTQRRAKQRADRQVRNKMIVHDVEVHDVGAGIEYGCHILAEPREICG